MTTPVAFFLIADDRPSAAPWGNRILTMFSLLHQHATAKSDGDSPGAYADLVEKAFSNLPGLAASKQRFVTSPCASLASGFHTLLATAPGAKPDKQLAFLEAHDMLSSDTASPEKRRDESSNPHSESEINHSSADANAIDLPACFSADMSSATKQSPQTLARTWTIFLGVVPRAARDAAVERRLWIAFVRWEPSVTPKPDLQRDSVALKAGELNSMSARERLPTGCADKDSNAGLLHARVLEATLHATFFDRYADRWSRFADNAPPERIRNDAHFLFIPL